MADTKVEVKAESKKILSVPKAPKQMGAAVGCVGRQWTGFRDFLLRGNVVDLAIAIVVGTALKALVTALVADLITPLISAIWGGTNFGNLYFSIHGSRFLYGDFINNAITFVVICAVCFFCIVKPMNILIEKYFPPTPMRKCPECLEKVPSAATRCKFCTAMLAPELATTGSPDEEVAKMV